MRRSFVALLALAALLVAACADASSAGDLEDRQWVLKLYPAADGTVTLALYSSPTTATFEDGTLTGNGGCNDYRASYKVRRDNLKIGPVAATSMACGEQVDAQERAYLAALERVASFEVDGTVLVLFDDAGSEILSFEEALPLPLVGIPWQATTVNTGTGALVVVGPDAGISLVFGASGEVAGFTGCNRYSGPYRELRGSLRIGPVAVTNMACPETADADLETAYLAALDATTEYEIKGATLELRNRRGEVQAAFRPLVPEPAPTSEPSAGPSAEPTPEPTAEPTATPAPTRTPQPTAGATATPAPTRTPQPTAGATATPAPTAAPTPVPTPVPLTTCPLPAAGVVVSYPAAWFTVQDVPELTCVLYGPEPVTVDPVTRATNAKVLVVASSAVFYDDVVAALTNRSNWTDVTTRQTTVSTLPATVISGTSTGAGTVPAGITQYAYVVDRGGPNGVVIIQTAAAEGATDAATNRQVVDLMAANIQIDARPK